MVRCSWCGKKLSDTEVDWSLKYLEEGLLCSKDLADIMDWIDYGEIGG